MAQPFPDNVCEEKVFRKLFFEYARKLRNFLYYKCGNADLAEDLTQEAYLRLWKECRKVPYQKARSFLFTVANNLFLDEVKHRKVVNRFELQMKPGNPVATPHELLTEKEFKERLERAIAALPENSRVVFLLNRLDQMTYKDIALLLGVSVKTVEKRMHKALIELRKLHKKI